MSDAATTSLRTAAETEKYPCCSQRGDAASRTVRIALVFANVHHQPRIERAAVQAVGQAELHPIGMLSRDGVAARKNLRLHRTGQMHEINSPPARIRRSRRRFCNRLLSVPRAEHFFGAFQHRVRLKITDEQKQTILRRVKFAIHRDQIVALVRRDLLFARRNLRVRMSAKQNFSQPFASEESGFRPAPA